MLGIGTLKHVAYSGKKSLLCGMPLFIKHIIFSPLPSQFYIHPWVKAEQGETCCLSACIYTTVLSLSALMTHFLTDFFTTMKPYHHHIEEQHWSCSSNRTDWEVCPLEMSGAKGQTEHYLKHVLGFLDFYTLITRCGENPVWNSERRGQAPPLCWSFNLIRGPSWQLFKE